MGENRETVKASYRGETGLGRRGSDEVRGTDQGGRGKEELKKGRAGNLGGNNAEGKVNEENEVTDKE